MTRRGLHARITATAGLVAVFFVVLGWRAVRLTLIDGAELRRLGERQHRRWVPMPPRRGPIVDRAGVMLAMTRQSVEVFLRPHELDAGPETLRLVARLLDLPERLVEARAHDEREFVWLDRQVAPERWATVAALEVPGIGSRQGHRRVYPQGDLAAQLLGFVDIDGKGLEGIEREFDRDLRGEEEEALAVERDAWGRRIEVDGVRGPLPRVGARVELTIDGDLQREVEAALADAVRRHHARAGTAVVLDPNTGEVLAMATAPSFNPYAFSRVSAERRRNRAVTDSYEPGSTFKAILVAAALDAGIAQPDDVIDCENGRYRVGRRVIHDHEPARSMTVRDIVVHSSNIGAAKLAERFGPDRFAEVIQRFGFGKRTGIDFPGETAGLVRPRARWRQINLVTTAFGQGISVTPVQLIRAFAALANGGFLMRPYIVRRVMSPSGHVLREQRPRVLGRVVSSRSAATVTELLEEVVERGTGRAARIPGVRVAGKTGTSQKVIPGSGRYSPRDRMASFAGYVPADRPRLAILVVIDTPEGVPYGGVVAAPVFRRIAEFGLAQRGIRPLQDRGPEALPVPPVELELAVLAEDPADEVRETYALDRMPDLTGMGMRDALVAAHRRGLEVTVRGSGYVVQQQPQAGKARGDGRLELTFDPAVS